MAAVILTMPGPPGAPYPNGGDEAYWMGQVRGALASRLAHNGIALLFGFPEEPSPGDFHLALCSQQAPPGEEGARKGPRLLCRAGDGQGRRGAGILARRLGEAYPQPELVQVEEALQVPELGEGGPAGAAALALARGLAEVLEAPFQDG